MASLNKSDGSCLGRREVRHVGIAFLKVDISGCGGAFVMIPGPLNSRLRALSVDVTTLN